MCNCSGAKRTFPLSSNSRDGAMGKTSIYPHTSKNAGDAKTTLSFGSEEVSTVVFINNYQKLCFH